MNGQRLTGRIAALLRKTSTTALMLLLTGAGCTATSGGPPGGGIAGAATAEILPVMGHRNWIVIADSAYPWQARPSIQTIVTDQDQLQAVKDVLDAIDRSKAVRPDVWLDAELPIVPESDAPGITSYRDRLSRLLATRHVQSLPHEQMIRKLDAAGENFRILIVKTNLTLPYTTVFLQLDCKYWTPEAEQRLRAAIAHTPPTQPAPPETTR